MRAFVLILMFSFPLFCNAAEVYKWRDKDGNIHYSDVEPPKQDAQRKSVKARQAKPLTADEQAAKEKADKLALQKAACDKAKQNVATITDARNTRISMDLDNDGKPEELTAEQRAAQVERMKATATLSCTP